MRLADRLVPLVVFAIHGDSQRGRIQLRSEPGEHQARGLMWLAFKCALAEAEPVSDLSKREEFHLHAHL